MREILFRGFHADSDGSELLNINGCETKGFWVTGCLVDIPCEDYDVCIAPIITDEEGRTHSAPYWEHKNVTPETIGQFTGLLDKNGKQIFEGDVVSYNWSDYGFVKMQIVYDGGSFFIDPIDTCEIAGQRVHRIHLYTHGKVEKRFEIHNICEVIGTIFDVKE